VGWIHSWIYKISKGLLTLVGSVPPYFESMATITEPQQTSISLSAEQYETVSMPPFDPTVHLDFAPPTERHSFTSLNLPRPAATPDMCFTEPFQLFSDEGVRIIRRDLLRKEVLDKHLRAWERAPGYIGGAEEV
jgi:hypothetical protein